MKYTIAGVTFMFNRSLRKYRTPNIPYFYLFIFINNALWAWHRRHQGSQTSARAIISVTQIQLNTSITHGMLRPSHCAPLKPPPTPTPHIQHHLRYFSCVSSDCSRSNCCASVCFCQANISRTDHSRRAELQADASHLSSRLFY